jgi:hypothetical protein
VIIAFEDELLLVIIEAGVEGGKPLERTDGRLHHKRQ